MSENAERFTGRVSEYVSYRTRYPQAVVEWLRSECGLTSEWVVADVGAGTGMLSEVFLKNGNRVMAVEPNAEMRAACALLEPQYPRLTLLDGTAEKTQLNDSSIDMIAVGRAFHWFEPMATAREFRRILHPNGWVAMVSSGRGRDDSSQEREYEAILLQHGTDPEHVKRRGLRRQRIAEFFPEGEHHHVEFSDHMLVTLDQFLGMTQSISCAPLEGSAGYVAMRSALEEYFARWSKDDHLSLRIVCTVDAGRLG